MNTLPSPAALRRLRPAVYLKAASLIDEIGSCAFACNAVKHAAKVPHDEVLGYLGTCPEAEAFVDVLKPDTCAQGEPVSCDEGWYSASYHPDRLGPYDPPTARVLGLLLMRELVLDARKGRR